MQGLAVDNFEFTKAEKGIIKTFLINNHLKVIYWKEYGINEWYWMLAQDILKPVITKSNTQERKAIKTLAKFKILIPEIDDDKEYKVQRSLGLVQGRVYYMPEEMREKLKDLAMDL